jgi:hypothetical protein
VAALLQIVATTAVIIFASLGDRDVGAGADINPLGGTRSWSSRHRQAPEGVNVQKLSAGCRQPHARGPLLASLAEAVDMRKYFHLINRSASGKAVANDDGRA